MHKADNSFNILNMKIAIDCRMSGKSGIGAFFDGILPYIIDSGNEILLIGGKNNFSDRKNVTHLECDVGTFSLKEMFAFPSDLRKAINDCDLYYTPYCNIPNGIQVPVFSTIHDIVFLDVKGLSGKIGTFVRKMFYLRAIRKSEKVFTVSEFSKSRIIEKLHCKKPIDVVYGSVPKYISDYKKQDVKKDSSIIFIGNIKHHKGLQTLLPAFISFREDIKKAGGEEPKLLIVGSKDNFRTQDSGLDEYMNKSSENGIEFTGFVSDEKLLELLVKSKLLVQPSLYEGFGMPPLQALFVGTRVLISDIPVFKEIYKDYPVDYFKVSDEADLKAQLEKIWKENDSVPPFEKTYSFERCARLVMDGIYQTIR